jgi:hypothetical protein
MKDKFLFKFLNKKIEELFATLAFKDKVNELIDATSGSFKSYTASLTQSGTDAPVATVFQNSLSGAIVWARTGAGVYTGTLASAFTASKTVAFAASTDADSAVKIARTSANVITVTVTDDAGVATDALLTGTVIEVRVYA